MKYIGHILLGVLVMAGISSCGDSGKDNKKKEVKEQQATTYRVLSLAPHQISGTVQLPGVMQPFEYVMIYPKVSGFVKTMNVDRGSVVRKGQVLMTLEAPEIEQHVAAAKLQYTQAHATLMISKDRYKRLLETSATPGTVSMFDLESAKSRMMADSATAQGMFADYKAQETMQAYLTITAPFDGVITERDVHPGALVGPGSQDGNKQMLVLQQQSRLRLVVSVPEQYSAQVSNADKVHYKVNALPGQDFEGAISRSSGSLSNNYRSETIEIDVMNPRNVFKPGMYAEVTLPISGSANAYVVPKSAIVTTTERKYVIVVDNNTAKWVDVSEGNQENDSTEIFGNVHDDDQVIVNAGYQIKDGQQVNIK